MAYIGKRPVDTFPANNAVTASIISANAVGSSEIANGAVGIAELATNAVTSAKLAQNSVLTKHIDDGQVTADQLSTDAVTTVKITDSNVTTAKIADDAVTLAKMAGLTRGSIIVGDSSGNPSALALGSNGQVLKSDGTDLVFGSDDGLTTEEVQDIVGGMVSSNTETGITVTYEDSDGTLDFAIGSGDISTAMLAADAVTAAKLADDAVVTANIVDANVTTAKIANNAITSAKIPDGSIGATQLASTAVTAGNYGSSSAIPVITVDADGRITAASTAATSSTLTIAADSGSNDTVTVGTDTLTFAGTSNEVNTTVSDNQIQIGLPDNVTIGGNLTVTGNYTVNGTTTTVATSNMVVSDNLIELNNGASSNANDSGIVIERGSTGDNAIFVWDESADKFVVGTTTATGASTGDLTITTGTLVGNIEGNVTGNVTGDVTGNADTATALETARTIHGVSFDGSANIDLTEVVQDTVGAMFSSNTESGITVDYQDSDGTIDLTVGTLNQNTTGTAASWTTARTLSFTGDVTGSGSVDGSANVATALTIASDAVEQSMIADDAVGADQLAANSVVSASIVNGSIVAADLADNCITSAKIVNGTIVAADIANNAILTQHIDDNQITGDQIADDIVLSGTGALRLPDGTTAQRPGSPAAGMFRYNTTTSKFEGYTDAWGDIGGGGSNTFARQAFTGDGSTTDFTLSQSPDSENNLIVFIEGVFQDQDAYSVSGTTLTFGTAPVNGRGIIVYHVKSAVSGTNLSHNQFNGDGSAYQFTLSIAPVHENNTMVYIDGVYQNKTSYSISGTTLDFGSSFPPPNGSKVECMTMNQLDINVPVDDTISTAKLQASAVTEAKIAVNAVTSLKIAENAITARELATNAIATLYIADNSVTSVKIAQNSILTKHIDDDQIVTSHILDSNVTTAKIADNAVTAAKIGIDVLTDQVAGITSAATPGSDAITIDSNEHVTIINDLIVDTDTLKVDSGNNRVGIGTANPSYRLTAKSDANTNPAIKVEQTGSTDGWGFIPDNTNGNLEFSRIGGGTAGTHLAITNAGNVGIGTTSAFNSARLSVTGGVNGTHAVFSGQASRGLKISTENTLNNDDGVAYDAQTSTGKHLFKVAGSEKMRIDNSGNVTLGSGANIGTAGSITMNVGSTSSGGGIQLFAPTDVAHGINFGDAYSTSAIYAGAIEYNHASNYMRFFTASTEKIRIAANGDLGWSATSAVHDSGAGTIGAFFSQSLYGFAGGTATNTDGLVEFNKTNSVATNNNVLVFSLDGSFQGDIDFNGGVVRYNTTSDYRRKENVTPLENATNQLKQLKTYNFNFIDNPDFTHQGFLAHEAQEVVPNAVSGSKDAVDSDGNPVYQTMDNSVLVPLLVKTIQELEARITTLEGE